MNQSKESLREKPKVSSLRKPLSRRQMLGALGMIAGIPAAASGYGFGYGPQFPRVEEYNLSLRDLPSDLTVIQISDLHFKGDSGLFRRTAKAIDSIEADFLFITGDLVEDKKHQQGVVRWLGSLNYAGRAYFCPGNWEIWSKTLDNGLTEQLAEIGIRTLTNEGLPIDSKDGQELLLVGIDDAFYGVADTKKAFANQPVGCCTLAISHAPCVINRLENVRVDLLLTGHTHGGQIRLPFIGALKTPPGSSRYEAGFYEEYGVKMYVNRGVGTS